MCRARTQSPGLPKALRPSTAFSPTHRAGVPAHAGRKDSRARRGHRRCPMSDVAETLAASAAIIDFHAHHVPPAFELTAVRTAPPSQRARWEAIAPRIADEDVLLADIRAGE